MVEARREGKFIYDSLRDTGEELIRVVGSLLEAAGQGDPFMGEESEDAEVDEGVAPAHDGMNDVSDGAENEG